MSGVSSSVKAFPYSGGKIFCVVFISWSAALAPCTFGFGKYTQSSQSSVDLYCTSALTFKVQYPDLDLQRKTNGPLKVINSAMAAFILETMAQHGEPSEVKSKNIAISEFEPKDIAISEFEPRKTDYHDLRFCAIKIPSP